MAAQKRKSTIVEHSAKRRKLDNDNKLTNLANKERNFETRHVSNKSKSNNCKVQKKNSPKTFVKADRSLNNKTTNNFTRSSSQTQLVEKSQSKPELSRTTHKTLPLTQSALKSPNRKNSSQTSPKSSKVKHKNPSGSNNTISNNAPEKAEKSNLGETKIYFDSECQPQLKIDFKNSSGIQSIKNTRHSVLDPARTFKTTQRSPESEMKATRGKSKENNSATSTKIVTNNNKKTQEVKNSQRNLTKSACKELEKLLNKSSSDCNTNETEQGTHMTTRSTKAFFDEKKSNCIHKTQVTMKKHSPEPRQNRKPQKKTEISKSKCGIQLNEQLNRRSQRLQQLVDVSTKSLRNREIKSQVLEVKQTLSSNRAESCSKIKIKPSQTKIVQKNLKRKLTSSDSKEDGLTASKVSNSPKKKKCKVNNKLDGACGPQHKQGSEKCHQHEIKKEDKNSVPVISSQDKKAKMATSLISKRNKEINKELVHTKPKSRTKSKNSQPTVPEENTDKHSEEIVKTKRVSILELCEEIAGEIESDTVEVKRETSFTEGGKEDESSTKLELTEVETQTDIQKESNENVQCKRFFPSRKANPVKCVLNGLNRLANKKSKWTKIKLGKANHLQQNSLGSPIAPKMDLLKNKLKSPQASIHLTTLEMHHPKSQSQLLIPKPCDNKDLACQEEKQKEISLQEVKSNGKTTEKNRAMERATENGQLDIQIKFPPKPSLDNQMKHSLEPTLDESFSLYLESSPENTPMKNAAAVPSLLNQAKNDTGENKSPEITPKQLISTFNNQLSKTSDNRVSLLNQSSSTKCNSPLEIKISKDLKLKEAEKDGDKQLIIDAGQKRFGAVSCNICGMLYTASNPEDETQHLLFHNQFISAVKYVVLLIYHHECGSEEELITSIFLSMFNFRYTQRSLLPH
ncbi:N-acetyltransferase ESCO1 isoform X2 [Macrotis lagotis]|uniref:N-acetyltransferase ESCO1 isoform X2 n=1 Tax=Macrotis lagotis TaxID=92651 RepID=UPI003D6914FB